jgi:signal transduction histidine kinase
MSGAVEMDFRVLFERAPGLYLVLDPHFFIIAVSDNYLSATKLRRENIVGQHLFDALPDNAGYPVVVDKGTMHSLRRALEYVVRERAPKAAGIERRASGPGGGADERFWNLLNTPVLGDDGQVRYIIHHIEDVTELVRLKKSSGEQRALHGQRTANVGQPLSHSDELGATYRQLEAANEELALRTAELHDSLETMQTFTYTIAHDLRAPLRQLTHFSTIVMEDCGTLLDDFGKDCLRRIGGAAQSMDRLVTDLLAYGQLTHVEVTMVPIALEEALNKALQDLASRIAERKAEIDVQRPLPRVIGNVALMNQVLINLIDNALKFVPRDKTPHIVIRTAQTDNRVRLSITDNGIGIQPAHHARVFNLFVRLHKSTEYSGTGIGLALVKKATERMMGKVGLESTSGEGSCFWLEFRAAG